MSSHTIETAVSIGYIRDLIIESLVLKGFVADNEEVTNFKFGGILNGKPSKLNEYLNKTIPITYTVRKEQEIKVLKYGRSKK